MRFLEKHAKPGFDVKTGVEIPLMPEVGGAHAAVEISGVRRLVV